MHVGSVRSRVRAWKSVTVAEQADESGQSTAEYALVILGAVAIATLLITWATGSHAISQLFDSVIEQGAAVVTGRRRFPRAGRGGTRRHRARSTRARSGDGRVRVPAAARRAVGAGGDPGRAGRARPARGRARGARGGTGRERRSRSRLVRSVPRTARCPAPTSRWGSGPRSAARSASPSTTRRSPTSRSSGSCSRIPICTRRR